MYVVILVIWYGTLFCYNFLKNAPIGLIFKYDACLKLCYKLYEGRLFSFSRFWEIGQEIWLEFDLLRR